MAPTYEAVVVPVLVVKHVNVYVLEEVDKENVMLHSGVPTKLWLSAPSTWDMLFRTAGWGQKLYDTRNWLVLESGVKVVQIPVSDIQEPLNKLTYEGLAQPGTYVSVLSTVLALSAGLPVLNVPSVYCVAT